MDYTIEENLIAGIRKREGKAFEHLRKTCFESIRYIAESYSKFKEDPEDLFSECLIVLTNYIDDKTFIIEGKVTSLMITIAKGKNIDNLRKENSKNAFLNDVREEAFEEEFEDKMDQEVYQGMFWQSVQKLKEDCRNLIRMVTEGVPQKKIADRLGFSYGSVRNKKKQCLNALNSLVWANPNYAKLMKNEEF